MRRAAVIIPGIDRIGGAEKQAISLAVGLRQREWSVSFVALSGSGGNAAETLREAGVEFTTLGMRKGLADPSGWVRFHHWLQSERPDVVHAHLHHAAWLVRWSRLAAHIPVVVDTLHSSCTGPIGRRMGYASSRWLPDHVTAVSRATAVSHLTAGMVSMKRLSIVPNGIAVEARPRGEQTRAEIRRELGLRDEFLWIAAGRLEVVKDYPTLLRALSLGPKTSHLAVLGAGPLHSELIQLTEQLGLGNRVRFFGYEPHVERWMQAADGFVLSSRYEGLPMALLEAGACGLPSVATDVPGTREVLVNGETGWLAPASGALGLAAAMRRLESMTAEARRAMGESAREYVTVHFGMEHVLNEWERLYELLLTRKNASLRMRAATREDLRRQNAASA